MTTIDPTFLNGAVLKFNMGKESTIFTTTDIIEMISAPGSGFIQYSYLCESVFSKLYCSHCTTPVLANVVDSIPRTTTLCQALQPPTRTHTVERNRQWRQKTMALRKERWSQNSCINGEGKRLADKGNRKKISESAQYTGPVEQLANSFGGVPPLEPRE